MIIYSSQSVSLLIQIRGVFMVNRSKTKAHNKAPAGSQDVHAIFDLSQVNTMNKSVPHLVRVLLRETPKSVKFASCHYVLLYLRITVVDLLAKKTAP